MLKCTLCPGQSRFLLFTFAVLRFRLLAIQQKATNKDFFPELMVIDLPWDSTTLVSLHVALEHVSLLLPYAIAHSV